MKMEWISALPPSFVASVEALISCGLTAFQFVSFIHGIGFWAHDRVGVEETVSYSKGSAQPVRSVTLGSLEKMNLSRACQGPVSTPLFCNAEDLDVWAFSGSPLRTDSRSSTVYSAPGHLHSSLLSRQLASVLQ